METEKEIAGWTAEAGREDWRQAAEALRAAWYDTFTGNRIVKFLTAPLLLEPRNKTLSILWQRTRIQRGIRILLGFSANLKDINK